MSNIENHIAVELTRLHQEIERLRAINAELLEALEPFAKGARGEILRALNEELLEALQNLL